MPYVLRIPRWLVWSAAAAITLTATAATPEANATTVTAQCQNTATDATTIRSAINTSSPGDTVVFRGHCLVTSTIKLLGNRTYTGEHRTDARNATTAGSTLQQANGTSFKALLASDSYVDNSTGTGLPIKIKDLALWGNGNVATSGIILRSWMTTVDNLYITGFGRDGIRLSNPSDNGTPLSTSTQVNGRIVNSMIEDSGRHGIYAEDPEPGNVDTDWQVLDTYIAGAGGDGIRLDNAAGWMIERNHLYGVKNTAIYAHRLWGTAISDNYIEDFGGSTTAGTYYGIKATLQGDDSASTIANNRVFEFGGASNAASQYVFVDITGNYGTGAVAVTGNTIRGPIPKKPNTTGLAFAKGHADGIVATSTGNLIDSVATVRSVGTGVTVTAGQ